MKVGETITVHFGLGPVRGKLSFKCPPPGQWVPDEALRELWQPVGETLDGSTLYSELDLEVTHDTINHTPGAENMALAAVHGFEHSSGHRHLFALGDFSTNKAAGRPVAEPAKWVSFQKGLAVRLRRAQNGAGRYMSHYDEAARSHFHLPRVRGTGLRAVSGMYPRGNVPRRQSLFPLRGRIASQH